MIISITGNSGSGKDRLIESLKSLLPFNSTVMISGDSYHKYTRAEQKKLKTTNLNPKNSDLVKLHHDIKRLKNKKSIAVKTYDHFDGKFGKEFIYHQKKFIFFNGLHNLINKKIRNLFDLNIFIDMDYRLNRFFKVRRDVRRRNYNYQEVLETIKKRENEYKEFIKTQSQFADIIIKFKSNKKYIIPRDIKINKITGLKVDVKIKNKKIDLSELLEKTNFNNYYNFSFDEKINLRVIKRKFIDFGNKNNLSPNMLLNSKIDQFLQIIISYTIIKIFNENKSQIK